MIVDPSDLSPLYFRESIRAGDPFDDSYGDGDAAVRPFVHAALAVAPSPLHGNGLVSTQDIRPGTCLFVTPPVVSARVGAVFERHYYDDSTNQQVGHGTSSRGLEGAAEQVLLEAIRSELQAKSLKARSVLSLVGSTNDDPVLSGLVGTTSIELLTGQDTEATRELLRSDARWCYELEPSCVPDSHLREIVRRNAFGPDFVGYDKWQHHLDAGDANANAAAACRPFRLLGLYPLAATLNHSCVSNAIRVFAGEVMVVHASQPISAGTEVVWSYVPPIEPHRNEMLQAQYGFRCRCEQCQAQERLMTDQLRFLDGPTQQLLHQLNRRGVSLESLGPAECEALLQLVPMLEDELARSDPAILSNPEKRYLRLGWMYLYLNYLNLASLRWRDGAHPDLVSVVMQIHLAYCASHNASTEHLSVLHVAYEMAASEQARVNAAANVTSASVSSGTPKVQFWTRQLQMAHTTRYGMMGGDVERVRECLIHTRGVVRRRDGYARANYRFL